MPEEVEECVSSVLDDDPEMGESAAYAICHSEQKAKEEGVRDLNAVRAVAYKRVTGEWPGDHPSEATKGGREHMLETHGDLVDKAISECQSETTVKFKARLEPQDAMHVLYKEDDGRMLIWGPASVEMVDKENDRITSEALKGALPQLMRRQRLSLEHSDQLVGDIKEKHEFEEPKTVKVNGTTIERREFPTDVLKADEAGVPHDGLYVAGEVWSDTKQAQETQKDIDDGVIDSYSISGEAIESSTRVKDGELVDDIKSIDLSAVTLCEEGMNQKAKFATLAKNALKQKMPDDDEDDPSNASEEAADEMEDEMDKSELQSVFKEAAEEVLKERLPDGELATKDDILSEDNLREKYEEWSKEGDVDPDEVEDPDDDGEEEVDLDPDEDDEMPPEEEKAVEDVGSRIEAAADALGKTPEEVASLLTRDEDDEDEDLEDDMEEMSAHDVSLDTLKSSLPDDLYSKVAEHLSDPGDGEIKSDDGEEEKSDDGDGEIDKSRTDPDAEPDELAKAAAGGDMDAYLEEVNGASMPDLDEDQDLAKAWDGHEDVEERDGNLADEFYEEGDI